MLYIPVLIYLFFMLVTGKWDKRGNPVPMSDEDMAEQRKFQAYVDRQFAEFDKKWARQAKSV